MKNTILFSALLFIAGICLAQTQFARAVGGTSTNYGRSVIGTSDGGFVIAGYTESFGAGSEDLFLVKFTSTGAVEWSRAVGGTDDDWGYSVVQTADGGYAVAGMTYSFGAGYWDFFLVKFDSDGNSCIGEAVSPTVTITSPSVASPSPSVASPSPTVTTVTPTITDVSPIVTEICTGLEITETIIKPQRFEIIATPNPFNSAVTINIAVSPCQGGDVRRTEGVQIEIFDLNGRMVYDNPVGEGLRPSRSSQTTKTGGSETAPLQNEFIWQPVVSIGSGVYLVRARIGDESVSKRVVYLK